MKKAGLYLMILGLLLLPLFGCGQGGSFVDEDGNTIRANGRLPDDIYDFTDSEESYYMEILVNAALTLDLDTLRHYVEPRDEGYEMLETIANNEKSRELWLLVTKDYTFYPDSCCLVGRNMKAMFDFWYADYPDALWATWELGYDDAKAVYDAYYEKAPFSCILLSWYDLGLEVDNGRLICHLEDFFGSGDLLRLDDCMDHYGDGAIQYGAMVLGYGYGGSDTLSMDFPEWELVYQSDLDALTEYLLPFAETDNYYYDLFQTYFMDETNREILEHYLKEECMLTRNAYCLHLFHPATRWDLSYFTSMSDWETVRSLPVMESETLYYGDFDSVLSFYYDVIQGMISENLLPEQSFS